MAERSLGQDLDAWLTPFLSAMGRKTRRTWAPLYLRGLLGPGDRKSLQPMAARLGLAGHDQPQHFIASPAWDDGPLWAELARTADRLVGGPDACLVIDDTALPKMGARSVGVAHQYCGALGKKANCQSLARTDADARRLTTIPGIGALNATALVAAIGDVTTFARRRDLAACLGLVPRQVTTGGKPRLVGITKRGSKYLRKTLIQGARAAMPSLRQCDTRLGQWLRGLLARAHVNTAVGGPGGQDSPHRRGAAAPRTDLRAGGGRCLISPRNLCLELFPPM